MRTLRTVVFFFFISKYAYHNQYQIPQLRSLRFIFHLFYLNRKHDFFHYYALLLCFLGQFPVSQSRLRSSTGREWQIVFGVKQFLCLGLLEKLLFFVYPRNTISPLVIRNLIAQNNFSFTLRSVMLPEEFIFRLRPLDDFVIENLTIQFFFNATSGKLFNGQRNLLRLLNVPLTWR
jgi:hypothetical protein